MEITFLGTGTSTGVPEIGCTCKVCQSNDKRDKRLRTSILVSTNNKRILLDCGPDFRQQIMTQPFAKIDAVLLSHEHYDHVGGLDDLRPFGRFGDLDIYAEKRVCDTILERMPYCFAKNKYPGSPNIFLHQLTPKRIEIAGLIVQPIRIYHGRLPILGFRIENMAYMTDLTAIPESEYSRLENLDVLIIDALRWTPHLSHQTVEQAIAQINRIGPRKAYLIHLSHHFGLHAEEELKLPPQVAVAYDGLTIDV